MIGYTVWREMLQADYWGDHYFRDGRLVFPKPRIKVFFSNYHFAIPQDQVSLVKNVRRFGDPEHDEDFGKEDIGLERLGEMTSEEWNNYMQQEIGWSRYSFGFVPFEVEDGFVDLLVRKMEHGKEHSDETIDKGLRQILFSNVETI